MEIVLSAVEKGGDYPIAHDLNFAAAKYEAKHAIVGLPCTALASHSRGELWLMWIDGVLDVQEPEACPAGRSERIGSRTW